MRDRFGVRLFGNEKSKRVPGKKEPGVWWEGWADGWRLQRLKSAGAADKSGSHYIRLVPQAEHPWCYRSTVKPNEKTH